MKSSFVKVSVAILGLLLLSGGLLVGGQGDPCCPPAAKPKPAARASANPVFCPVKSAGRLCDHGTTAILNLEGEKRARWNKAVRNYNRAVESAQSELVREAQKFPSPEEAQQVESWFAAKGKESERAGLDGK
ncbi:MAG: hypothetical protein EPN47_04420 [Acidobacteria bacterium]|nr:MAG: hypothetical protein EPN47_04420 [Acidobacteriota bacterium]